MASGKTWPERWTWELDCTNPHLAKRMLDRRFNETELREMLQDARNYREDQQPGRWVVTTTHNQREWEVVVEPDIAAKVLVVVSAFCVE
jgi:hypothetical protein